MNQNTLKYAPVRLDERKYEELREKVLRRDCWRCQFCGSMSNLEIHHRQFRSHSGLRNRLTMPVFRENCPSIDAPTSLRKCDLVFHEHHS
jgi:5-methylcytosine-specific restriction endonuclease McrA